MAFFDRQIECRNKTKKQVRIPSHQGGNDRNIYVNGSSSGYYLGEENDKIYRSGSEVSSSDIPSFAKQNLGCFIYTYFKNHNLWFFLCIEIEK